MRSDSGLRYDDFVPSRRSWGVNDRMRASCTSAIWHDIGIAVSSSSGVVVGVLRDNDRQSFWQIRATYGSKAECERDVRTMA